MMMMMVVVVVMMMWMWMWMLLVMVNTVLVLNRFITTMMVGVFLLFLTMEAIISFIPRLEFDEFRSVGVNR